MDEYRPIACIEHEKLEFAVLKRQALELVCLGPDKRLITVRALPQDVYTRDGAEWLRFTAGPAGAAEVIRLDAILRFAVLT